MKVNRYYVGTHTVEGEVRPVYFLQFDNGDARFVFEREVRCCERGGESCGECRNGVKLVDVTCDAIANTEDSELYLPPLTTRVNLAAFDLILGGQRVEVL